MARVKLVVSRIKNSTAIKNNEIEMKGCNLQFIAGYKNHSNENKCSTNDGKCID